MGELLNSCSNPKMMSIELVRAIFIYYNVFQFQERERERERDAQKFNVNEALLPCALRADPTRLPILYVPAQRVPAKTEAETPPPLPFSTGAVGTPTALPFLGGEEQAHAGERAARGRGPTWSGGGVIIVLLMRPSHFVPWTFWHLVWLTPLLNVSPPHPLSKAPDAQDLGKWISTCSLKDSGWPGNYWDSVSLKFNLIGWYKKSVAVSLSL